MTIKLIKKFWKNNLISNFDPVNIESCSCIVRVGKAFLPGSGNVIDLGSNTNYKIKPSESLIIMSEEIIKLPLEGRLEEERNGKQISIF